MLRCTSRTIALLIVLVYADVGSSQEFRPLPPVAAMPSPVMYDPQVVPVGVVPSATKGPAMLPSSDGAHAAAPSPIASSVASSVVTAGGSATPASNGLSQADVERIVAEYLSKRESEGRTVSAAVEAPLPVPADTLPSQEPEWYRVGTDTKLTAHWKHGLELESANKDFKVHVGGRTQFDTSFFSGDNDLEEPIPLGGIGPLHDSMQFRRARLRVDGTMYEQIEFAFEYEFLNDNSVDFAQTPPVANATPAATDLWVNFSKLPLLGNIKVGNQKNPIGFEHLTSSRYLDFIERSFNQDLFYGPFNNGFSPGIVAWDSAFEGRATWAAGAFAANMNANTNIFGYGIGTDYMYVMRGTMLPYWDQDGRYMVHLGASYEFRDSDDGRVRVRTRGNIRNGPPGPFNSVYADTTNLLADDQDLLNFEGVFQWGSLLIQSEYCFSNIYSATQVFGVPVTSPRGNVSVNGGYIEMLYFLTGEHRHYDRKRGFFDRVIPNQNSFRVLGRNGCVCTGPGAWQVGIRYDRADLNDNGVNGGMLNALTLGLNWFLNPNMKVQFNWDWTHRGQVARFDPLIGANNVVDPGDVFGFGTRLAIDF